MKSRNQSGRENEMKRLAVRVMIVVAALGAFFFIFGPNIPKMESNTDLAILCMGVYATCSVLGCILEDAIFPKSNYGVSGEGPRVFFIYGVIAMLVSTILSLAIPIIIFGMHYYFALFELVLSSYRFSELIGIVSSIAVPVVLFMSFLVGSVTITLKNMDVIT